MNFQAMRDLMDGFAAWRIPGNAAKVWLDGKEVFSYQSGFADLEAKEPMTTEHMLNLYSCSKVATVTAALQLYEKGFFLLDDPLYEFIPEFGDMQVKTPAGIEKAKDPITLRHLFTMTSGLNYNCGVPAFEKARALTDGKMDTLTVVKCLAEEPLDFEPGSHWQYSLSHDVLAAVVEVISGKKFRDYMKENIFDPLDMKACYHNEPVQHRMAQLYRYDNSPETDVVALQSGAVRQTDGRIVLTKKRNHLVFGSEYDSGGAGITTTVSDYAKFCAALANHGLGHSGNRILSPGTVALMKENQLSDTLLKEFNWPQYKGYGYGLGGRRLLSKAASGSTGSLGEFGWAGAAGGAVFIDTDRNLAMFYAHHMLNPQEEYYLPRVRNVLYKCLSD